VHKPLNILAVHGGNRQPTDFMCRSIRPRSVARVEDLFATFRRVNNRPAAVSKMEGFIGTTYLPEPLRTTVNTNLSRLATNTSLRCAAHELPRI
jgi:hypothetical protein